MKNFLLVSTYIYVDSSFLLSTSDPPRFWLQGSRMHPCPCRPPTWCATNRGSSLSARRSWMVILLTAANQMLKKAKKRITQSGVIALDFEIKDQFICLCFLGGTNKDSWHESHRETSKPRSGP